ncbi:MAG: acetyl-CoA carboxylase biotin carboxyl carrier protein [bacterium]
MTNPEKNEKKKKAPATPKIKVSAKLSLVQDALALMEASQVNEFRFEQGDTKIHLRKGPAVGFAPTASMMAPTTFAASAEMSSAPAAAAPAPATVAPASEKTLTITAPMVGTFYRSPSPEAKAFAEEGSKIEVGQVYCIIEAMKLMNEVKSEVKGKVVKILVANGQAVEFGQPLLIIDPS